MCVCADLLNFNMVTASITWKTVQLIQTVSNCLLLCLCHMSGQSKGLTRLISLSPSLIPAIWILLLFTNSESEALRGYVASPDSHWYVVQISARNTSKLLKSVSQIHKIKCMDVYSWSPPWISRATLGSDFPVPWQLIWRQVCDKQEALWGDEGWARKCIQRTACWKHG